MKSRLTFIIAFIALNCISLIRSTILDKIRDDPDFSQFYDLLEKSEIAKATLQLGYVTLFVPTNRAFQKIQGNASVLYHISTIAYTKEQLPSIISSHLEGNPPLHITRNPNGDIFVNNARLEASRSLQIDNNGGYRQVMHVINDVLQPLTILPTLKAEIINPDAYEFLTSSDSMNIVPFWIRTFRSQVTLMRKENLYQSPGAHTFLIPIDEGFEMTTLSSRVDNKVIDDHVILNKVIFTAAAPLEVPQTTAAFEDNIKVTISFLKQENGRFYVKSNTILGDTKYPTGFVIAEIVKGNIPVKNGVVHLIHRPLVIVEKTATQFLQDNGNGTLQKFYETIMDIAGEVLDDINKLRDITILAPSNEAWNNSNVDNVIKDREKMRTILNMHIIKDRMNLENIKQRNKKLTPQVPTLNIGTFLCFYIIFDENNNEIITVEGGGVNATILQTDFPLKNGYVHIIDKVLGMPDKTVLGKLTTDPVLQLT